jgi:predicted RNase H-like HicB family nuclease
VVTKTYFAIVDQAAGEAISIVFPAFPGTTSVAETAADIVPPARDALASVVDDIETDGGALPPSLEDGAVPPGIPSGLHRPFVLAVEVEAQARSVRVNISIDEALLARLDAAASRAGTSRSALLAKGARMAIAAESNA